MERVPLRLAGLAALVGLCGLTPAAAQAPARPATATATSGAVPARPAVAPPAKPAVAAPGKPAAGAAAAGKPATAARPGAAPDASDARRNADKTRANSVLKSDKLLPGRADLRSEAERKRDAELRTHFARIASLDVIAAIASESGDLGLQEDVEQVRRKELQRHQKAMMAQKRAIALQAALAGGAQP
jgi:hypothetical protein